MNLGSDMLLLALVVLGGSLAAALTLLGVLLLRLREAERRVNEKETTHESVLDRLQENEYRLRTIIESEPECVKLQAEDGTVLEINPAGLRLVDANQPADIVGRKIYSVVAPECVEAYRENMRRVFAGEAVVYEFKAITLKNRIAWMETHAAPLRDARGNIYALLGITRDITEHKQAEEQARRHQTELARVARLSTMGEMATGIAHELNQPLSAIANFSRGCIRRLRSGGMSPNELIEPLEEVCAQAERAGDILRHVRDFVRKSEPRLKPMDVNQIVRSVVKFTEHEARQHRTMVRLQLDPHLPKVLADAIMIEQVICNLVRNAMEAMAEANSPCAARWWFTPAVRLAAVEDRDHRHRPRHRRLPSSTRSSTSSSPPSRRGSAWACRSAARSSSRTAAASGPNRVAGGGAIPLHPASASNRPC
jgi:two-component system sensor kinase FixL